MPGSGEREADGVGDRMRALALDVEGKKLWVQPVSFMCVAYTKRPSSQRKGNKSQ
jgi:hypothetical protein